MPQNTLTDPPITDLVIRVHDLMYQGDPAFIVTVQTGKFKEGVTTRSVERYAGLMVDFLPTLSKDIMAAWLFGDPRDVQRAAQSIYRAARRHAEDHEAVTLH